MYMPAPRSSSASGRLEGSPKRNTAAGKRLAPLPPGLRTGPRAGRTVTATATTSSAASSSYSTSVPQDLARTVPSLPAKCTSASADVLRSGRRQLPPMLQTPQSLRTPRGKAGVSARSVSGASVEGRGTATSRRTSHDSLSASVPASLSSVSRADARPTSLARRTSAPGGRGSGKSGPTTNGSSPNTAGASPAKAQSIRHSTATAALSARLNRPQPRPPTLQRASAANGSRESKNDRTPSSSPKTTFSATSTVTTDTETKGISSVSAAHPVPGPSATPANTTETASRDSRNRQASLSPRQPDSTSVVGSSSAPEKPVVKAQVVAAASSPPLSYEPHDHDEAYYQNPENWTAAAGWPSLVPLLLQGMQLEPPYTTCLWTQAYPDPAPLLASASSAAAVAPSAQASPWRAGAAASTAPSESLPLSLLHCDATKRIHGFYSCVRCGTPICSPVHQVIPAASALRGIAVFDRVNLESVDLRLRTSSTPPRSTKTYNVATSSALHHEQSSQLQRLSLSSTSVARHPFAAADATSSTADNFLSSTGELRFVVHCRHCHGCLGVVFLGDVQTMPSTAADTPSLSPSSSSTEALLCANSVCLTYVRHLTRAKLDGIFLDASAEAPKKARATFGSLFGGPRQAAWDRQGSFDVDAKGMLAGTVDDDGADASFDDLLEELNPYRRRTGADGAGAGSDPDD